MQPEGSQLDLRADRVIAIALCIACAVVVGVVLLGRDRPADEPNRNTSPASLIDLNSASAAEIELLPEIGPALAARIVESREKDGAFRSPNDLDRVRGIGKGTIERVTPLVECVAR
ncbi:MAG: helix-hairpin-helix domain-containing protein [Phycisphaerales bacterium]